MISILMPLYNGAEYLNDSISSVQNQTYTRWELLIGINGHSIEECNKLLYMIQKYKDRRIKVFFCKDKNKSKTLNFLAWRTKYSNICLLDVDDMWHKTKLEKQLLLIDQYDVVGTDCEYFGDISGKPDLFLGKLTKPMFSFQNPVVNSAVMIRRKNKKDIKWDENWEGLDDYNLWIDLLNANKTFYNIPEVLVKIRIHDNSYFNNNNAVLNKKLLEEKITKIPEEQLIELGIMMDNKKWNL